MPDGTMMPNEALMNALDKLAAAKGIFQENGHYKWFTSSGKCVEFNNVIEFAITYFIMLFSLFFTGADKFTDSDYFLAKRYIAKI